MKPPGLRGAAQSKMQMKTKRHEGETRPEGKDKGQGLEGRPEKNDAK